MNPKRKYALVQDELEDGWDALDDSGHGAEGLRHHLLKHAVAHEIRDAGREAGVEVAVAGGVVDVLDLGESEGRATAIEIETSYSRERAEEKLEQYQSPLVRDVIVLPAREAPSEVGEWPDWIREHVSV